MLSDKFLTYTDWKQIRKQNFLLRYHLYFWYIFPIPYFDVWHNEAAKSWRMAKRLEDRL